MPQVRFDVNQRGPRPANRPRPLVPRHPAAVRQEQMREEAKKTRAMPQGMVRVKATNRLGEGMIAKFIFHPSGRRTFDKNGYAEWPNDSFTRNRVRDGDVTIEDQKQQTGEQRQQPAEQRAQEHERRRPQQRTEQPARTENSQS
jgi:hypothetical protein